MTTTFIKGRNRAFAQLNAPINGSATNIPLVAGHGSRLYPVTTASGLNVRAHIIERDPVTNEVIACEIVNITNNVSDILTVTRAVESTRATDDTNTYAATAQSFSTAAYIEEIVSLAVLDEMRSIINTLETSKLDASVYAASRTVYAASSTGNDSYAITTGDSLGSVADGRIFAVRADVANNGAASLNVDGLGAVTLKKISGGAFTDLVTGDIIANQIFFAMRNTAASCFQFSLDPATLSLTPADADETTKGIAERATDVEALLFADITRFVNAYQLGLASTLPEQNVEYESGNVTQNVTNFHFQTSLDGSIGFLTYNNAAGTTAQIYRLQKDNYTGQYYITHKTSFPGSSSVSNPAVIPTSTYLYLTYQDGGTASMRRYSLTDLSGATTMTISGTAWTTGKAGFSDGTDLYVSNGSGSFRKYTISGTTATHASAISYTSAGDAQSGGACTDGTYVWIIGAAATPVVIRKYAIAGGAAISSVSPWVQYDAHSGTFSAIRLYLPKIGALGLAWAFGQHDASAMVGSIMKLQAIARF